MLRPALQPRRAAAVRWMSDDNRAPRSPSIVAVCWARCDGWMGRISPTAFSMSYFNGVVMRPAIFRPRYLDALQASANVSRTLQMDGWTLVPDSDPLFLSVLPPLSSSRHPAVTHAKYCRRHGPNGRRGSRRGRGLGQRTNNVPFSHSFTAAAPSAVGRRKQGGQGTERMERCERDVRFSHSGPDVFDSRLGKDTGRSASAVLLPNNLAAWPGRPMGPRFGAVRRCREDLAVVRAGSHGIFRFQPRRDRGHNYLCPLPNH
ncbi:hypothetical protein QBC39DRAFT_434274 [Podospora conica]|nr:hypothetical protein QBC39DRAFT_434274 [Schizothecium conicum]